MARLVLTQVQKDCLEHCGVCLGCPNTLESQECQVKYTKGVARKLGLREREPKDPFVRSEPVTQICGFCDQEFQHWDSHVKFCKSCAALKTGKSQGIRVCACGQKFFGTTGRKRCDGCRDAAIGGKETA